jgi:hypothetical protein
MLSNSHNIHERSKDILIKQNTPTFMKENKFTSEYSLKQNFFDPTKSSPPNDFMIKLQQRMMKY